MKKILFTIFILLISINVKAACSYSEIARLKSVVSNVNTTYDYKIIDNEAYFDITLTNLTTDIYFVIDEKTYYPTASDYKITNYNLSKLRIKFYSKNNQCYGTYLGPKYITFPQYNPYYGTEICDGVKELEACKKWVSVIYSYNDMEKIIENYYKEKEKDVEKATEYKMSILDRIINFYAQNYIYIFGVIIAIGGLVILIYKRRTRVDLDI